LQPRPAVAPRLFFPTTPLTFRSQEELELPYEIKKYQRQPDMHAPHELFEIHPCVLSSFIYSIRPFFLPSLWTSERHCELTFVSRLGQSPAITDGDFVLAESGAIVGKLSCAPPHPRSPPSLRSCTPRAPFSIFVSLTNYIGGSSHPPSHGRKVPTPFKLALNAILHCAQNISSTSTAKIKISLTRLVCWITFTVSPRSHSVSIPFLQTRQTLDH
jgi:hypothetical protein